MISERQTKCAVEMQQVAACYKIFTGWKNFFLSLFSFIAVLIMFVLYRCFIFLFAVCMNIK